MRFNKAGILEGLILKGGFHEFNIVYCYTYRVLYSS